MPITKSAKKALRKSLRKRVQNLFHKNRVKEILKKFRKLVGEKRSEEAKALLPSLYKFLDKAAKKGVIHENKVERLKSKLTKSIANLEKKLQASSVTNQ